MQSSEIHPWHANFDRCTSPVFRGRRGRMFMADSVQEMQRIMRKIGARARDLAHDDFHFTDVFLNACRAGNMVLIADMAAKFPKLIEQCGFKTPVMHWEPGNLDTFLWLLSRGATIGDTAITPFIKSGCEECVVRAYLEFDIPVDAYGLLDAVKFEQLHLILPLMKTVGIRCNQDTLFLCLESYDDFGARVYTSEVDRFDKTHRIAEFLYEAGCEWNADDIRELAIQRDWTGTVAFVDQMATKNPPELGREDRFLVQ